MHEKGLYVIGNLYVDAEAIQFTYEITHYFQNVKTDYILLPSTPLFREAAAEIAVRLSASLLTDCIALSVDNGRLQGLRPSLDGKSFSHYAFSASAPGNTAEKFPGNHAAPGKIVFVRKIIHENVSKDIKDAPLIFAGGRGLMNEQSFEALRRLADFFDASVGASRPVVDCGWAGPSEQIGQIGSVVHPKVYLAFGISGAIQHLAGMKNSQCIIAVNTNLNSPIFQYYDYGIRGDANSIIRNLLQILAV